MKAWTLGLGKQVEDFAKQLARDLAKRYPPALQTSKTQKVSVNRITRLLEDAYSKAIQFKNENKLGAIRVAKLGNIFRWELVELGYTKEFIDVASEGLVVYLTRKKPPSIEKTK